VRQPRIDRIIGLVFIISLFSFFENTSHAKQSDCVRRVKHDNSKSGDGLSWKAAYRTIGEAIREASAALAKENKEGRCEVWVAEGTYNVFKTNRADTLQLARNVDLYGGFKGTETRRAQRNFQKNETIIDGRDRHNDQDSVYHVIIGANNALLDGFTVAYGNARRERFGGGMYNDRVSPIIRNCVFRNNEAGWSGGAIFNNLNKTIIEGCRFKNNKARSGGAVANQGTTGKIINTIFTDNHATSDGGALFAFSFDKTQILSTILFVTMPRETAQQPSTLIKAICCLEIVHLSIIKVTTRPKTKVFDRS